MKALATLRLLSILVLFTLAASNASATDGSKKAGRRVEVGTKRTTLAGQQRKMVAAFVDPTAPLAEMVERLRSERSTQPAQ